jgi:hypothetical protein
MASRDEASSGHSGKRRKYTDVHVKIVVLAAFSKKGKIRETWWSVVPGGVQFDGTDKSPKGKLFWEALVFDAGTGHRVPCRIRKIEMSKKWDRCWGMPQPNNEFRDGEHWKIDPVTLPTVSKKKSFAYTVYIQCGTNPIKIDPEIDFDP